MADFALLIQPGSYHSSVGAFLDAFALVRAQVKARIPAQDALPMETGLRLLSRDGHPVVMADGRSIAVDDAAGGTEQFDLILIPAFRVDDLEGLDQRLDQFRPLYGWLTRQRAGGALLAASGPGTFLLAGAGMLDDVAIPLPRALVSLCRQRFPRLAIDDRRAIVERDGIMLGAGLAADHALMARVIERTVSGAMGRWIGSIVGVDRLSDDRLASDPLVANAQLWLEQRFAQDVRITELATAMATTQQTLIRRFQRDLGMSPKVYIQHLRILTAQLMLRRTRRRIEQIAAMVGYQDVRSFRTVFRARAGVSPSAYRAANAAQNG